MSGILLRQQEVFSSYPSPPQPAGCVTATPLHWLLSKKISCAFFIESAQGGPNPMRRLMQLLVFLMAVCEGYYLLKMYNFY